MSMAANSPQTRIVTCKECKAEVRVQVDVRKVACPNCGLPIITAHCPYPNTDLFQRGPAGANG